MAHQSEHTKRLNFINNGLSKHEDIKKYFSDESDVILFSLPYLESSNAREIGQDIINYLHNNLENFGNNTLFCFLSNSQIISEVYIDLHKELYYKLSIAVKLSEKINRKSFIDNAYANLLILSNNKGSLRHTKTRIAYTYCPVCNKTTKDYGGRKHLYHNYGTLISDVWRDITYTPETYPEQVIDRLLDLFGLDLYKNLIFFDFSKYQQKSIETKVKDTQLPFIINNYILKPPLIIHK